MKINQLINTSKQTAIQNSPAILTGIGVAGTLATAFLTGKAAFKAADIINREYEKQANEPTNLNNALYMMDFKRKASLTWSCYIPPAVAGVGTIAAIVSANRISAKRTAAIAAAYTITERAYSEYKDQVKEQIGKNKEQKVRDAVAQKNVTENPPSQTVIINSGGDSLWLDGISGRYFMSDMETVKKAVNDTNYSLINHGYASLTEFYNKLGLAATSISDNLGWRDDLIELVTSTTVSDDDRPVMVLGFDTDPEHNFFRAH